MPPPHFSFFVKKSNGSSALHESFKTDGLRTRILRLIKMSRSNIPAILEFILQSLQWLAYSVGVLMLWELMIGCQLSCYILATHALYLLSEWTDWHIFPFAFVLWGHITRWQITEITNYPRYLKDLWKTFADHVCFRVFCICCCCPREGRV